MHFYLNFKYEVMQIGVLYTNISVKSFIIKLISVSSKMIITIVSEDKHEIYYAESNFLLNI